MKKYALFALVTVVFLLASVAIAEPGPFENPDGAVCVFLVNIDGDYGPVGAYFCDAPDGNDYIGYGPPDLDEIFE